MLDFVLQAVPAEVSYFAIAEACLTIVTLLAFFCGKTVIKLSLGFILILRLVLYFASHIRVSVVILEL